MDETNPSQRVDPVIEYYKRFVDRQKLRANLKLSVDERLHKLQEWAEARDTTRMAPPSPDCPWEPASDCGPSRTSDPVIELYKRDVDRTLLRENLKLTPEERLLKLRDFMQFAEEVRSAGIRARETA
ncbi:MAG TPA: hypothetical protein VHK01_00715 [Lacipirellulaceae bacterium]|jgi:hypothetical protein|nr:hypothetical protein [Lacipirellulaceae bacterium]